MAEVEVTMDPSSRLLAHDDYLGVIRLVAEVAGADGPGARRSLLVAEAARFTGAHSGVVGVGRVAGGELEVDPTTVEVFGQMDEEYLHAVFESGQYQQNPILGPGLCRLTDLRWFVADRREFFDDGPWEQLPFVQSVLRRLDIGPSLYAISRLDLPGQVLILSVHRAWADKCLFGPRDRQVLDLLMEVAHRLARLLHSEGAAELGLSRRLQQTLRGLLAGQSEKEIARDLAIRSGTVHHYVTMLYRRFGVHSARELMAVLRDTAVG